MIVKHERTTPKEAKRQFDEWASLFEEGLFVHLVVYADESGTHDKTGVQKGSRQAIVGGIVAPTEDWSKFCSQWQFTLNKYKADYFHFREWSIASRIVRGLQKPDGKKNPYQGWNIETLDSFLLELATIAGSGNKLVVGGSVFTKEFNEAKISGDVPASADPYSHCLDQFFASVVGTIHTQRAPWKRMPLTFFFDGSEDVEWKKAVIDMHDQHKKRHRNFGGISFQDKKKMPYLPLQAADMAAYRLRQITEQWVDGEAIIKWPEFTEALFKSTFDFLETKKKQVFMAYLNGELDYDRKK